MAHGIFSPRFCVRACVGFLFFFHFSCVCFSNSIWMDCLREYNVEAMGLKDLNGVEFLTIMEALGVVSQGQFILS